MFSPVSSRLKKRPRLDEHGNRRPRVCLCACGSVAAVKVPETVAALIEAGCDVDVVLTAAARHFVERVEYVGARGGTPRARQTALPRRARAL